MLACHPDAVRSVWCKSAAIRFWLLSLLRKQSEEKRPKSSVASSCFGKHKPRRKADQSIKIKLLLLLQQEEAKIGKRAQRRASGTCLCCSLALLRKGNSKKRREEGVVIKRRLVVRDAVVA